MDPTQSEMETVTQLEPTSETAHLPAEPNGAGASRGEAQYKRPVVIDGCNLSNLESNRGVDTGRCVSAISYFRGLGHHQIAVVFPRIPSWETKVNASGAKRRRVIEAMAPYVYHSPARVNPGTGLMEKSDDDMYLLEMAKNSGAVVVSNDQFRTERAKDPSLADVIDHRLLQFTMAFGNFQVAQDPRGSGDVRLNDLLHFPPGYKPRTLSDDIQDLVASESDPNNARMDQAESSFAPDSDSPYVIRPPIVPSPTGLAMRQSSEPSFGGGAATPSPVDRQPFDSRAPQGRSRSANSTVSYSSLSDYGNGNGPHDNRNGYSNRYENPVGSQSTTGYSPNRSSPGRYSSAARHRSSFRQHENRDYRDVTEGERMGLLYSGFGQYFDPGVTATLVPDDPPAAGGALTSTRVDTLINELWPLVYCPGCPLGHDGLQAVVRASLSQQPASATLDAMATAVIDAVQKARDEAPAVGELAPS